MSGDDNPTSRPLKTSGTHLLREIPHETPLHKINSILMEKYDFPDFKKNITHPKTWPAYLFKEFRDNWASGLTVALVSIPLSVSLAIASDATPIMGIVTAVWGGLIASIFGGSEFNIVGQSGAISGILSLYSISYGQAVQPLISLLSGMFILIVFILRLQKFFLYIPSATIQGFTVGVAFIIALNQLGFALGLYGIPRHDSFTANLLEHLKHISETHIWTFLLFLADTIALLSLSRWKPNIPWIIIFSVAGILLGVWVELGGFPIKLMTLNTLYSDLTLQLFSIPTFSSSLFNFDIVNASLSVAFITVLETLISAKIADRMTNTSFSQPREIFAVGLGNLVSGCFGGIPASAALARTALNIKSGAKSRWSGIINAISMAVISLLLLRFFKYLLLSMIASILVFTSVRMIDVQVLTHMFYYDKVQFAFMSVVALVVVLGDPISGIVFGGIIGLLRYASANSVAHVVIKKSTQLEEETLPQHLQSDTEDFGNCIIFKMFGDLSYLNAASQIDKAKQTASETPHLVVILSLRYMFYMDIDGMDALTEIVHEFETKHNKLVLLTGLQPIPAQQMRKVKWFKLKRDNGYLFDTNQAALDWVEKRTASATQKRQKIKNLIEEGPLSQTPIFPSHITEQTYCEITDDEPQNTV